ncbi:MAG: FprA family A-type flavoprotein [Candidatus Thorarchaeota archaeon]|jgi:flavorubredoxin
MHRKIAEGVYYIGVDDHHTELFEGLWKLPFGVSYNSYLIVDEKVALIETVKEPWTDEWLENIRGIIDPTKIDYIILNHMEPDHTGALPHIAEIAKNATIIYTPKASDMQKSFYDVPLSEKIVYDLEEVSLGKKTLKFVHAKFLHWPETMMTYMVEDEILFSCDAFGAFGALNGKVFDDEIDLRMVEMESRRYLSGIITTYFPFVQRAIKKVVDLGIGIKVVAPSHGPIYRKDPMWIISRFDKWTSKELEKKVAIVYGSMYGFNQRVAFILKKELQDLGVAVKTINISYTDLSVVLTETVHAAVIVIGTPTYDAHPFPLIWHFMTEMAGKRYQKRPIGLFGNYGWQGGGLDRVEELVKEMKCPVLEPIVRVKARPNEEQLDEIRQLAKSIAEQLD